MSIGARSVPEGMEEEDGRLDIQIEKLLNRDPRAESSPWAPRQELRVMKKFS
jgi:hypothetical protein